MRRTILLGALAVMQLASTAPASAVPGLHMVPRASGYDSGEPKTVKAHCPPGEREAFAPCGGGRQLHSAGASITNRAPARVSLQGIFPDDQNRRTRAVAVENVPTGSDWDFIVASAICAA